MVPVARVWRLARIIGGFGLVFLGVIGLFLPLLPGILFIVAGLVLLAREYHWARRLLDWVKSRRGGRREPQSPGPAR